MKLYKIRVMLNSRLSGVHEVLGENAVEAVEFLTNILDELFKGTTIKYEIAFVDEL